MELDTHEHFGQAGGSDTYLGELVELNQSDTYICELDKLSKLSDTTLKPSELSDTEVGACLVAGRNGPFSAHGKIHNKFNLGLFYSKFDQAFGDGLLPICIKKYQQKKSKSSIDHAHQPEIWRCMYSRDGAAHGCRCDDHISSQRPRKLDDRISSNQVYDDSEERLLSALQAVEESYIRSTRIPILKI
ncbi:hypothetical protein F2Q70_00043240 [Brassica cretica]|uniref:Uncharacterized protein n=1 Tax=Brassica cretica TaxID=69181 RepID=A0A8S9KFX5_BRACR|nr:hypothetical protein F2Q70_00043240 [Brassica cretica]